MVNLKSSKIYILFKKVFFTATHFILKTTGLKNRGYYYSKWVADNDGETLLAKYPLNYNSVVLDVGGYTGHFSDKIIELYNPHLIIFEPVKEFYSILRNKYKNSKRVVIYCFGLSDKNSTKNIYLSNDGTSLIKKTKKKERVKIIDVADFVKKFKHINLMSINIEGAEYEVLERLIETNLIKKIKFLQVQFHPFVPKAEYRRKNIIKNLLKSHNVYFSYPFVWESFKLRS